MAYTEFHHRDRAKNEAFSEYGQYRLVSSVEAGNLNDGMIRTFTALFLQDPEVFSIQEAARSNQSVEAWIGLVASHVFLKAQITREQLAAMPFSEADKLVKDTVSFLEKEAEKLEVIGADPKLRELVFQQASIRLLFLWLEANSLRPPELFNT